jgi:nuclear transport factor 2 (NTF2) superfamily protein
MSTTVEERPDHVVALDTQCAIERDGSVETRWRARHAEKGTLVVVSRYRAPDRVERWTVRGRAKVTVSRCTPAERRYSYRVEFWGFGGTLEEAEREARQARRDVLRGEF